jgi:hypothetical protein
MIRVIKGKSYSRKGTVKYKLHKPTEINSSYVQRFFLEFIDLRTSCTSVIFNKHDCILYANYIQSLTLSEDIQRVEY